MHRTAQVDSSKIRQLRGEVLQRVESLLSAFFVHKIYLTQHSALRRGARRRRTSHGRGGDGDRAGALQIRREGALQASKQSVITVSSEARALFSGSHLHPFRTARPARTGPPCPPGRSPSRCCCCPRRRVPPGPGSHSASARCLAGRRPSPCDELASLPPLRRPAGYSKRMLDMPITTLLLTSPC